LLYHLNVPQSVAIVVPDLMFQSRIEAAVRAAGLTPIVAATAAGVDLAIAARPTLAVIDLHGAGIDTDRAIREAKAAGMRVLAFGRHTEPATLRAARDAGADRVVPRSQLVEELHELIASLVGT
jgi:DNA-binding NarL/FixJ family response regulator